MTAWDPQTLDRIGQAEEMLVAPARRDGTGYRAQVPIWHVVVDGELYARAYTGAASRWYRAAARQRTGRIGVAGLTVDVDFDPDVDEGLSDRIDEAYRDKYGRSPYVGAMLSADARERTMRISPARPA